MQLIQFRHRQAVEPRAVQKPELHCGEAARAGREDNLSGYDVKDHGTAVDVKRQARLKSLGLPLEITRQALVPNPRHDTGLLKFLKRRDLSHVDQIPQFDEVSLDPDARIVADAEVPHRMRGDRRRGQQKHEGRSEN